MHNLLRTFSRARTRIRSGLFGSSPLRTMTRAKSPRSWRQLAAGIAAIATVVSGPIAQDQAPIPDPAQAQVQAEVQAQAPAQSDYSGTEVTTGVEVSSQINGDMTAAAIGQSTTYAQAITKLNALTVKGRAPKTGYSREQFGQAWADRDRNGCDTRNDILRRDLTALTFRAKTKGCVVSTGTLKDPYTGKTINFVRGPESARVQIDHMVALSDAWQKGAQQLNASQRANLANDPLNLRAVDGTENGKKSDGDAATWLPPQKSYRCQYVTAQVDVKTKYGLWVTSAEKDAIARILGSCSGQIPQIKAVPKVNGSDSGLKITAAPASGTGTADTTKAGTSKAGSSKAGSGKAESGPKKPISKDDCPDNAPIKGNRGSNGWIYHMPDGRYYGVTDPEECFVTSDDAERAGYRASKA